MQYLKDISALNISEITDAVKAEAISYGAEVVRMVLIDVFKKRNITVMSSGYNPATATKQPKQSHSSASFSLEEWKTIYEAAESLKNRTSSVECCSR